MCGHVHGSVSAFIIYMNGDVWDVYTSVCVCLIVHVCIVCVCVGGLCICMCMCVYLCVHMQTHFISLCMCLCVCLLVSVSLCVFPHCALCSASCAFRWLFSPRLGFLCSDLQPEKTCFSSLSCLARCAAVLLVSERLSGLILSHLGNPDRSVEKKYLPPYSSERLARARKWNSSSLIPTTGHLWMSHHLFSQAYLRYNRSAMINFVNM